LREAKQLSLSFLYWLQTEAPRPDGGAGWPGLYLRPDIVGTADGLAKYPYIRESRRIRAKFTVTENHVGVDARKAAGKNPKVAEQFEDSVGVGFYRIDLHPSTGGKNYIDIASLPFQVPLGALIPQRVENLLPASRTSASRTSRTAATGCTPSSGTSAKQQVLLAGFCLAPEDEARRGSRRSRDAAPLPGPARRAGYRAQLAGVGAEIVGVSRLGGKAELRVDKSVRGAAGLVCEVGCA
jgi:hypothetical protein